MAALLYLFGSGLVFYVGVALVLMGFAGRVAAKQHWRDRAAVYTVDLGLVLIALSAAPLPYWLYAMWAIAAVAWLAIEKSSRATWVRYRHWARAALLGCCAVALVWDGRYLFAPWISVPKRGTLYVIGDSLSAGVGDKYDTWPKLLRKLPGDKVHNLARAGATAADALQQAAQLPDRPGLVLIEIGGNDLLSGVPSAEFAQSLAALLTQVANKSADHVVMFEIPLPPLCNRYGQVQRSLAEQHRVTLIPKRVLMGVLSRSDATSDSIHLTPAGHAELAAAIDALVVEN